MIARGWLLVCLLFLLTGCMFDNLPSQSAPSCSWTTTVPHNAGPVCRQTYRSLSAVLRDSVAGNHVAVRRRVVNPPVANRIIAFGDMLRSQHVRYIRVVPSFTLETGSGGTIGASIRIVGVTARGKVKAPQIVYLAVRSGHQVIIGDQPQQEW